jgi:hypothetical protein
MVLVTVTELLGLAKVDEANDTSPHHQDVAWVAICLKEALL